jgi:hypothetical protein
VAIGASLLTSAYNNADATSYTTASVSPVANSLMLLFVVDSHGTLLSPRSVPTSSHGTWVPWGDGSWGNAPGLRRSAVWTLQCGASPGSGAITLTEEARGTGNATASGAGWAVIQVTGHHVVNPVRQAAVDPGTQGVTTSHSVTLSDPVDANSRAFAFFVILANDVLTPRTNWTELSDVAGASPVMGMQSQWRSDAFETTASATFSSADACGIAIEIAEASAANDTRAIVRGRERTAGVADNTVTVVMPAGLTTGDLLIATVSTDGAATAAAGGSEGWTQISATSNASAVRLTILAKIAAGSDSLSLTLGSAVDSTTHVMRITGHGVSNVVSDIAIGTAATGTSTTPDPPSVTPAANEPNLFIAVAAADDDDEANVFWPTNYTAETNFTSDTLSATTSMILAAYRYVTTGSAQDPGTFTLAASEEWVAQSLCIPPGDPPSTLTPLPGIGEDVEIGVEIEWDAFSNVTEDLREMTIRLPSRSRLQAVFQAGSATLVLDNRLRTYDPLYAAGPNFGNLKANRRVRITLNVAGGVSSTIFTGWTDGWSFAYDKSNNDATATITCIDALAKAGFSAIPAGTTPTLAAGEYVATRGAALVAAAGTTDITYSAGGGYARFGTTWDATVQHNLLTELRRCAELEVAPLLALDTGVLRQEARYWFATRALSATSNCTIPSATLPCTEVKVLYDARELVSAVSMTDEVGNVATATNAAAVTEFGERYADLNFNNMPAGDLSSLQGAAATWVGLRGGEEMRFDTVTILPQRSDDWWPHIQNRRILDRVTVSITPTDVGDPITEDAFIDGIEHHITTDSWVTTWHLLPAELYAAVDFFILGTDVLDGAKVLGY